MSEQEDLRQHGHPGNDGSEDDMVTKSKTVAELALVYIGIPGVTLYPLGLVALLIQLLKDPHFPYLDPVTAWTAVSIIPQTVVIWTGIGLVCGIRDPPNGGNRDRHQPSLLELVHRFGWHGSLLLDLPTAAQVAQAPEAQQ